MCNSQNCKIGKKGGKSREKWGEKGIKRKKRNKGENKQKREKKRWIKEKKWGNEKASRKVHFSKNFGKSGKKRKFWKGGGNDFDVIYLPLSSWEPW